MALCIEPSREVGTEDATCVCAVVTVVVGFKRFVDQLDHELLVLGNGFAQRYHNLFRSVNGHTISFDCPGYIT